MGIIVNSVSVNQPRNNDTVNRSNNLRLLQEPKKTRRPRTTLKMHSKVGLKTLDTHRTETIMYPQKCHYIGQFISFSRLTSSNSAGIIDKYTTWIITTTITPQTIQLLDILKILDQIISIVLNFRTL
jgi:hypothetical protein